MRRMIGCRLLAILAIVFPVANVPGVNVVNTTANPVPVTTPGGVMVGNPVGMHVPVTTGGEVGRVQGDASANAIVTGTVDIGNNARVNVVCALATEGGGALDAGFLITGYLIDE